MMFDEKPKPKGRDAIIKTAGVLFGLALILGYSVFLRPKVPKTSSLKDNSGAMSVVDAAAAKKSGVIVQGFAAVKTLLPDDGEGAKQQKFIATVPSGLTFLVSHNIDIAPRVPLKPADLFEFRGQYDWNDQGGLIHWTHHDPDMKHEDGWIKFGDKAYR